jgi:FK506-binding nuclear protein
MAAIDPTAEAQEGPARATLKLIRIQDEDEDEDDDDFDPENIEELRAKLLADGVLGSEDDSEDSEDDSATEANGGPSDPAKSKKALRDALRKKLEEETAAEEMDIDTLTNGVNGTKGKGKALDGEDSDESDSDDEGDETEELVLCTLDPEKVSFSVPPLPHID